MHRMKPQMHLCTQRVSLVRILELRAVLVQHPVESVSVDGVGKVHFVQGEGEGWGEGEGEGEGEGQ